MDYRRYGKLAHIWCDAVLENTVLRSAAGFYIGTADEDGPVSRESERYYPNEAEARADLTAGSWTQKVEP